MGVYIGKIGVLKGDARSLAYSSCKGMLVGLHNRDVLVTPTPDMRAK